MAVITFTGRPYRRRREPQAALPPWVRGSTSRWRRSSAGLAASGGRRRVISSWRWISCTKHKATTRENQDPD